MASILGWTHVQQGIDPGPRSPLNITFTQCFSTSADLAIAIAASEPRAEPTDSPHLLRAVTPCPKPPPRHIPRAHRMV
ncbi:MAG: hypothetical protein IGR92_17150 [Leptolyngbyaceae cyanobacterium T60_A2020_046]|nr:hypothetical protein [Leptolyngbyaceae cyanobacterium T60_A2020_046]